MNKIDFFCIGAGKSGTTWLWSMLKQHPSINLPTIKEMHYFNSQSFEDPSLKNPIAEQSIAWYHKHFSVDNELVKGDITPSYIWDRDAAKNIKLYNPNAKIIAILRDPYQRSWSQYNFAKNQGRIKDCDFNWAIENYKFLIRESLYSEDVSKFLKLFGDNVLIVRFEDIKYKNKSTLKNIEKFLGVDNFDYNFNLQESNGGGVPKYPSLVRLLTFLRYNLKKYNFTKVYFFLRAIGGTGISRRLRKGYSNGNSSFPSYIKSIPLLKQSFDTDIHNLEELTEWDLSDWYGNEE